MVQVAKIVLEDATLQYDKPYSYLIPSGMLALPGCRVMVPFGAGNRIRFGMIMAVEETAETKGLKSISTLVEQAPLLNGEMRSLVAWLRENTFCTYYDAVRTLLPPGIGVALQYTYELPREPVAIEEELPLGFSANIIDRISGSNSASAHSAPANSVKAHEEGEERLIVEYLRSAGRPVREGRLFAALSLAAGCSALKALCERGAVIKSQEVKRRILDEKVVMVRLADGIYELADVTGARLTPKQRDVVVLLSQAGQGTLKEICYFAGVGKTVVDRLESAGVVHYFTREVYRNPYAQAKAGAGTEEIQLSEEQQHACDSLCALADAGEPKAALLYGVTGSGKTEVFLRTIRHVLNSGRGVIVMVPEISLTPQTITRFHRYFGQSVAVLHSGLSMGERLDEWKRIKNGEALLVVGTRSAVFAPLETLGLIVMDEEQEGTYKSEKSPRYHARDVARIRAVHHKALLLLASATPSVESFYKAKTGKYTLLTLQQRYGKARLPDVLILDMSTQALSAVGSSLSSDLLDHLRLNLERGEQSILLLNRRGYNTLVKCGICGMVATCPHCSVAMTYHSVNGHLMCHYCGHTQSADALCPKCGSKFRRYSGAGTQKVEEELREILPSARILRMDMDTTMSRFSHQRYFSDFSQGKYDIIIGTQMVAKGLDFPNVTLVGILSADASLYAQDYRSFERAFSLFTQVVGRSGRAEKAGRAFIQTFTPENPIIELAASQNYDGFYEEEIDSRRIHLYPPFCDLVGVGFSGVDSLQVGEAAKGFLGRFVELAKGEYRDIPLRVLGPCESQISRIAGKYRWRMAVKCTYTSRFRQLLRRVVEWYLTQGENRGVSVFVDPRCESNL